MRGIVTRFSPGIGAADGTLEYKIENRFRTRMAARVWGVGARVKLSNFEIFLGVATLWLSHNYLNC